ncbi:MAG: hypothetical protein H0T05_03000 [Acidobacteria bacterium]|nr:hypothetical protein [Acidobacteriota bacterium]
MPKFCLAPILLLLTATDLLAACQKIPDLIAQLRPNPVERYFTRELVPLPFEDLVSRAILVVEGTVRPVRTYLTENQCYLYTDYEVSAITPIFGSLPAAKTPGPQPLFVRTTGGETMIDGVKVTVRDEQLPPFEPGQHVVLFLTRTASGQSYELVGSILGAFRVKGGGQIESLVREKGIYENVAGTSKVALAEEVRRIKGGQ